MNGVILFAHGSSVESANDAVRSVASAVARQAGVDAIETAFLDVAPRLEDAARALAQRGVNEILVIPYFLTLGIHLQRDLPRLISDIEAAHPALHIRVTEPLDGHPALAQIVLDRLRGA